MKKFLIILAFICSCGLISQAKTPKQPDTYAYTRGVEAYNQDDYADALDWFTRELSEHPENGYAQVYLAAIRYRNHEYGKALTSLDLALKYIPKKDNSWRSLIYGTRAEVYTAIEDTVSALNDLSRAIKIDPKSLDYYNTRAQIFYEQKNYAQSNEDYSHIITLDPGNELGYMGIGRNAIAQKNWNTALEKFNYVLRLAPDYSLGYSYRAEAYIGLEKWNEATDDIIKALDIDADRKAIFIMQYLPEEASTLLKSKLKIKQAKQPVEVYWPYYLGLLSQSNENYSDAVEYYLQANKLDADSVILEKIAMCYMSLNNYTKALDYAEQALSMNPEDYDIIELKADILARLGRYDECITERDKYIARYPGLATGYIYRASDLMNAGRYNEAIEDYNTAIVIIPVLKDSPSILTQRGDAYRLAGKKALADADYNAILTVEQDSTLSSYSCTPFAYSGLGNREKAIETMQYIAQNDTTDIARNHFKFACIYARLGDADSGLKALSKAINSGYKKIWLINTDYNLNILRQKPEFIELTKSLKNYTDEAVDNTIENSDFTYEKVEIPFTKDGGVTKVKCAINGLPLHFVFDTGAADVTISMVEANFMLKNDYIKPEDIIGSARYIDANGDINEGTVINIRNVNLGGLELDNVRASVVRNQKAPLLLGQSVLGRLGKIEIDNPGMKLIISHKVNK